MLFPVTAIYACILAVFAFVLSTTVTVHRARTGLSILHGDDMRLALAIRRHGNFIEVVPMALILILIAEARGMPAPWLHAVGVLLVMSRIAHAVGLRIDNPKHPLRMLGGAGSQIAILCAILSIAGSFF